MKREDDGRKPSANPTSPCFGFTSLSFSLSLCLVESRFHVGSLLNESKEEKEVGRGISFGDLIAFYALLLIITPGKKTIDKKKKYACPIRSADYQWCNGTLSFFRG